MLARKQPGHCASCGSDAGRTQSQQEDFGEPMPILRIIAIVAIAALAVAVPAEAAPLSARDVCTRWSSMKPMRSIVACSEVIRAEPEAAWAYLNRGLAHGAGGDSEREIADYTRALSFDPTLISALQNRGIAHFDRGDFGDAVNDLAKTFSSTGDPFAMLYLYLARTRGGASDAATELEKNADKLVASGAWPAPVVELYLGKKQMPAVLTAATTPEQKCQAHFYTAEWLALDQSKIEESVKPLRLAAGTCARDAIEFASALAELKRLGIGPPKPKPVAPTARAAAPVVPVPAR